MAWYAWHWADYERDTLHLSLEQDAIYRRLIDWYLSRESPIPDNDQSIATICRISLEKWSDHSAVIRAFFKSKNSCLHQKRCDLILDDQKRRSAERSEAAKKAAERRWEKDVEKHEDRCAPHAERNAHAMRNDAINLPNIPTDINNRPIDQAVGEGLLIKSGGRSGSGYSPSLEACDRLLAIAPGWDQHMLVERYNSWHEGQERPRNPDAAFLGWAKNFTKGKRP